MFTTFWWSSSALLATKLSDAGFAVTMLCPFGHAAHAEPGLTCIELPSRAIARTLREAVETLAPSLIVPMDDRAVRQLHALHAHADVPLRALIERSLGASSSFEASSSRTGFSQAARAVGIATPQEIAVNGVHDLDEHFRVSTAPIVLKVDGLTGGQGVAIASSRGEARRAFLRLRLKLTGLFAFKRWLINRDRFWLADHRAADRPGLSAQQFVRGRAGDLSMFCLDGKLLGVSVAEVEGKSSASGPSTFVRLVDRPELVNRARLLVESLHLSGFYGLDFIVDQTTGEELVIELNPRITSLAGLRAEIEGSPIAAAAEALLGRTVAEPRQPRTRDLYAHFPLAWLADPTDPRLSCCRGDVPWDRPRLMEAVVETPWNERGLLARGWSKLAGAMAATLSIYDRTKVRQPDHRSGPSRVWNERAGLPRRRSFKKRADKFREDCLESGRLE